MCLISFHVVFLSESHRHGYGFCPETSVQMFLGKHRKGFRTVKCRDATRMEGDHGTVSCWSLVSNHLTSLWESSEVEAHPSIFALTKPLQVCLHVTTMTKTRMMLKKYSQSVWQVFLVITMWRSQNYDCPLTCCMGLGLSGFRTHAHITFSCSYTVNFCMLPYPCDFDKMGVTTTYYAGNCPEGWQILLL